MGELGDHTDVQQRTSYKTYKRGSNQCTRGSYICITDTYQRGSNRWTRG
jgi:hypothetical protein